MNYSKSLALIKKIGWHEFLCKTNFSFLIGSSSPEEILQSVGQKQYSSIAINDFDGVYGLARSYLKHKKLGSTAKLIYGAEIHLEQDHHKPILEQNCLCLIAKTKLGYFQLNKIVSYMHREQKTNTCISLQDLKTFDTTDLVAILPMRVFANSNKEDEYYIELKKIFPYLYFSLTKTLHPIEDAAFDLCYESACRLEIPILLSQDIFFHQSEQKPINDIAHCIRNNKTIFDCQEHFFPNNERYPHKLESIAKIYGGCSFLEVALINAKELSDSISFCFSELTYQYPKEMIPSGFSAQSFLEKISWEGANLRYNSNIPQKVSTLIQHELILIKDLSFADYFLSVWDIVRWAREKQILCQGRGSAANSAVCYVLGITAVDPMQFDLLFERFISKERGDPPDIDVDFEHERREEVIQYIYSRYGRGRAAMLANVICYKRKGASRAVGKALGIDEKYLSTASKLHKSKLFRGQNSKDIISQIEAADSSNEDQKWQLWQEISDIFVGVPRHLGIHSGGFIISSDSIDQLVAQEAASMEGRSVIQWCKEDVEGLGFFKIDILALGMLSALRKCFQLISTNYQQNMDLYTIPQNDPATYQMIQKADTVGVFQIESRAQMSMLPRLKPKSFYDLVIEIAIIRPGPIQGGVIHPYLKRRAGLEKITYPDEKLRPILEKTLGIAIFQEQAMRIAIAVGDFTPGEADELRKNIGAWSMSSSTKKLEPMLEKLRKGMRKNKISEFFVEQICSQMKAFAEYGFPESHAVSFAFLAYASSYLKCHFPCAFFTSILNSQPMGFYSPHALLQGARRQNVKILPLSLQNSFWDFSMEDNIASTDKCIRLGFRLIYSLSKRSSYLIVEERKARGHFSSLEDFLLRCPIYRDEFVSLAAADCFAEFGLNRRQAIWLAEALPLKPLIDLPEKDLNLKEESRLQSTYRDFDSFQTSLGDHPCLIYKNTEWNYPIHKSKLIVSQNFSKLINNQVFYCFGMLLVKQAPPTANGMVFLTLEDEYNFINIAVSPQVYKQYYATIESGSFLCVYGKIQKNGDSFSVWAKKFLPEITDSKIVDLKSLPQKEEKDWSETKRWIQNYLSQNEFHKKRNSKIRSYF